MTFHDYVSLNGALILWLMKQSGIHGLNLLLQQTPRFV